MPINICQLHCLIPYFYNVSLIAAGRPNYVEFDIGTIAGYSQNNLCTLNSINSSYPKNLRPLMLLPTLVTTMRLFAGHR